MPDIRCGSTYAAVCIRSHSGKDPILPTVSIILAVHNGAALLRQKIAHLLSLDYPHDRMEIKIVSDGSTDGTDDILKEFQDPQVGCIRCAEHSGKAAALNLGMQSATGEILLFLDIRPWIESNALQLLLSNFADPRVGCVAGELVLRDDGHDPGTKAVGGLYWRYEQWIRNCEAKVDSPLGVYGGFYAVRRELARALPNGIILDDMLAASQCHSPGLSVSPGSACDASMTSGPRICAENFIARSERWPATSS